MKRQQEITIYRKQVFPSSETSGMCNVLQPPPEGSGASAQFFSCSVLLLWGWGGMPTHWCLGFCWWVMRRRGGGWDIKTELEREVGGWGSERAAYITSRCPLTLPGGWPVSTVWPWICLLQALLSCPFISNTQPFRAGTRTLHSGQRSAQQNSHIELYYQNLLKYINGIVEFKLQTSKKLKH